MTQPSVGDIVKIATKDDRVYKGTLSDIDEKKGRLSLIKGTQKVQG